MPIPGSGMRAPTFTTELVLKSVSSGVMDGAGTIGDVIGTVIG